MEAEEGFPFCTSRNITSPDSETSSDSDSVLLNEELAAAQSLPAKESNEQLFKNNNELRI